MDRSGAHCVLHCEDIFAAFYVNPADDYAETDDIHHNHHLMSRSKTQSRLQRILDPIEEDIGMWVMDDTDLQEVTLYATSFQEFLVRMYFEESVSRYWNYAGGLPPKVQEYLSRIYPGERPEP